jgi:hypothetical protein
VLGPCLRWALRSTPTNTPQTCGVAALSARNSETGRFSQRRKNLRLRTNLMEPGYRYVAAGDTSPYRHIRLADSCSRAPVARRERWTRLKRPFASSACSLGFATPNLKCHRIPHRRKS